MIIKGSRYSEQSEYRNNDTVTIALPTSFTATSSFAIVTTQNETFSSLASAHLNDPTMYWKIADLNKQLGFADVIPTGTVVTIPLK